MENEPGQSNSTENRDSQKEGLRKHEKFVENTAYEVLELCKKMHTAGMFQGGAVVIMVDGFIQGSFGKVLTGLLSQLFALAMKYGLSSHAEKLDNRFELIIKKLQKPAR